MSYKKRGLGIFILIVLGIGSSSITAAQSSPDDLNKEKLFDFWLGTWELTWEDADGTIATGTNHIERILNGKVIKENFKAHTGAYKGYIGKSYSVYQPDLGKWKQTWVDNQGSYLDFTGKCEKNRRMFTREAVIRQGEQIVQRMVFYDIKKNSLSWDWEVSKDDGKTWELKWRIFYNRIEKEAD